MIPPSLTYGTYREGSGYVLDAFDVGLEWLQTAADFEREAGDWGVYRIGMIEELYEVAFDEPIP